MGNAALLVAAWFGVIWNIAHHAEMRIGAIAGGIVIGLTGYPVGFALVTALLFVAAIPAWHNRRMPQPGSIVAD